MEEDVFLSLFLLPHLSLSFSLPSYFFLSFSLCVCLSLSLSFSICLSNKVCEKEKSPEAFTWLLPLTTAQAEVMGKKADPALCVDLPVAPGAP